MSHKPIYKLNDKVTIQITVFSNPTQNKIRTWILLKAKVKSLSKLTFGHSVLIETVDTERTIQLQSQPKQRWAMHLSEQNHLRPFWKFFKFLKFFEILDVLFRVLFSEDFVNFDQIRTRENSITTRPIALLDGNWFT